ncbi:MAG: Ty1/Copia family ribonuclease HI, partial [Leptolyngbyaceae cyanobacterium CAN_BIN12]|nr:Ty1/Copia family ribonuclease HI [Leptolyngbyaceae cyanobacterium CAN_BIN12]
TEPPKEDIYSGVVGNEAVRMGFFLAALLGYSICAGDVGDPMATINELAKDYVIKGVGAPVYYLGGNVVDLDGQWQKEGVRTGLSAKTYIEESVKRYERVFKGSFKSAKFPMEQSYHPETEESNFLDEKECSIYRGLIGFANWIITLGRFDIAYATNVLARFSAKPRKGHLEAAKRLFGYLKSCSQGQQLIDPTHRDMSEFKTALYSWTEFYPDATEEIPSDLPIPRGPPVQLTVYVDADHAHDLVTRRSVTGILAFVNNTPIQWMSKRQKTVETSTYGSELVAARVATEMILDLRYKLRMLGVPLDGPALML